MLSDILACLGNRLPPPYLWALSTDLCVKQLGADQRLIFQGSAWWPVPTGVLSARGLWSTVTQDSSYPAVLAPLAVDGPARKLANYSPPALSSPLPAFVNKVLLKHSPAHSFGCCLWLLSPTLAKLSICERPAECISYVVRYRKGLLSHGLTFWGSGLPSRSSFLPPPKSEFCGCHRA